MTTEPIRFFYDFEFLEDGKTVEPVSIGIVTEDGEHEYYAVFADAPWAHIRKHTWLMRNVVPHLPEVAQRLAYGTLHPNFVDPAHPVVKQRWQIAIEVAEFLTRGRDGAAAPVELWAYFAAYDHVALAQLWGPMIQMPPGIPWHTMDLQQIVQGLTNMGVRVEKPEHDGSEHNALADAQWNRRFFQELLALAQPKALEALQSHLQELGLAVVSGDVLVKLRELLRFVQVEIESATEPNEDRVLVDQEMWNDLGARADAITPEELGHLDRQLGITGPPHAYSLTTEYARLPAADLAALVMAYERADKDEVPPIADEAWGALVAWLNRRQP